MLFLAFLLVPSLVYATNTDLKEEIGLRQRSAMQQTQPRPSLIVDPKAAPIMLSQDAIKKNYSWWNKLYLFASGSLELVALGTDSPAAHRLSGIGTALCVNQCLLKYVGKPYVYFYRYINLGLGGIGLATSFITPVKEISAFFNGYGAAHILKAVMPDREMTNLKLNLLSTEAYVNKDKLDDPDTIVVDNTTTKIMEATAGILSDPTDPVILQESTAFKEALRKVRDE